jgi:hypothetical protein
MALRDVTAVQFEQFRGIRGRDLNTAQVLIAFPQARETLVVRELVNSHATGNACLTVIAARAVKMCSAASKARGDKATVKLGTDGLLRVHEDGTGFPVSKITALVGLGLKESQRLNVVRGHRH